MKRIVWGMLAMLWMIGVAWGDVPIEKRYTGFVHLPLARPGDTPPKTPAPQALHSQAEFDAFVSSIPSKQIQQRQPAPPSNDPLLKKPVIDFGKWTAIVVYSDFIYTMPGVERVVINKGTATVTVVRKTAEHAREMAYPLGIGCYQMVLVPRFDGKVTEAK